MRAERRLLADTDVAAAAEEVDGSGLVPLLKEFVHLGKGRPRNLTLRSLLIGLHLCTQVNGGPVVLERVTDILFFSLSSHARATLGVPTYPDDDRGFEAGYAVVRRLFHAMREAMNPSPLPANKRLSRQEATQLAAEADPNDLAEREHRLALFAEFVLDASVRPLKGLLSELSDGSLAVDATPIRAFARGRKTNGPELSTDPDAGWYIRDGDHRDPDTVPVSDAMRSRTRPGGPSSAPGGSRRRSLKKRAKYLFGYDAAIAVTRDAHHDQVLLDDNTPNPEVLPALVLGVSLDKPGHRPAYNGLKILSRLRERGYDPGYLADDLAYNNSDPDEWQLPVRALGYKPVYDYRVDQLGKQAETQGAILVEGTWYCPSMPQPLIDATKDLYAERIDRETWARLITARKPYRLMPKESEDAEGHQRVMCPADAGKAQCPIKSRSMGQGIHLPLVDPEPSPAGPLKVCRQRSVTVAPTAGSTGRPSSTATRNDRRSTSG
ncbi:hypothetical protein ABT010_40680, partial [Streptomyces sp. NPDC002668]|uniref:hypothetical protein n=1 Tax=Streptomyces sp. NPDC002668 TaxID=3154422 RepID=UPI0033292F41